MGAIRRELCEARDDLAVADAFGAMGEAVIEDLVGLVGDHPLFGGLEECLQREGHYRREALRRIDGLSRWAWAAARGVEWAQQAARGGEEWAQQAAPLRVGAAAGQMAMEFAA